MDRVGVGYSGRLEQAAEIQVAVEKVLDIIREVHRSGVDEVGFTLQYLYRKASICAEYLKGSDAAIYNALVQGFRYLTRTGHAL